MRKSPDGNVFNFTAALPPLEPNQTRSEPCREHPQPKTMQHLELCANNKRSSSVRRKPCFSFLTQCSQPFASKKQFQTNLCQQTRVCSSHELFENSRHTISCFSSGFHDIHCRKKLFPSWMVKILWGPQIMEQKCQWRLWIVSGEGAVRINGF